MIEGLGTDIIAVDRIRQAIARHGQRFLDEIFTVDEQHYCLKFKDSNPHFAGRFAAKEAIAKALGTGLTAHLKWTDMEILNDESGKPKVQLKNDPNRVVMLSISHCKEYATATAITLS